MTDAVEDLDGSELAETFLDFVPPRLPLDQESFAYSDVLPESNIEELALQNSQTEFECSSSWARFMDTVDTLPGPSPAPPTTATQELPSINHLLQDSFPLAEYMITATEGQSRNVLPELRPATPTTATQNLPSIHSHLDRYSTGNYLYLQPRTAVDKPRAVVDIAPSVTAFADSGYASSRGGQCQKDGTNNGNSAEEDAMGHDSSSIYTTVSSIPSGTVHAYVQAFAEELVKSVCSCRTVSGSEEILSAALPELLKSFTLSMDFWMASQMYRDVMVFIRKNRRDITAAFKEKFSDYGCVKKADQNQDKMSLFELIDRWDVEHNSADFDISGTGIAATDAAGGDDSIPDAASATGPWSLKSWSTSSMGDDSASSSGLDPDESIEENTQLPSIEAYTRLIQNSAGYNSLVANLRRECLLSFPEPNVMQQIRMTILSYLPTGPLVSRTQRTEVFEMFYLMDWDFLTFHSQQGYAATPVEVLEDAICVTGSSTNAQALPCREYILQTWPSIGGNILALLKRVLCFPHGSSTTFTDGSEIEMRYTGPMLFTTVRGPKHCIAEVGEILAWLVAALRSSPHPQRTVYCTPLIIETRPGLPCDNELQCYLGFSDRVEDGPKEEPDVTGRCWYDLFRNPVVVEGYPISRREQDVPGLELPLGLMAELTQTRYINQFGGKLLLKGFSSMLVPTAAFDGLVMWHLLHNQDGTRISYLHSMDLFAEPTTISQLEQSRHVLGWCPDMSFHAGAVDACYTVKSSRLPRVCAPSPLASTFLSMSQILTLRSPISVGIKDCPVHVSRNGYVRKMKWLRGKFVVLWDEEDKRGWLVNGPSALLHLVRASLDYDQRDEFHHLSSFRQNAVQEAKEPYKPRLALQVLLNPNNLDLQLYPERGGHTTFKDQVEYFYDVLEKIIDYQQHISTGEGPIQSRAFLEGWDFADLVKERDPIYPRALVLDTYGKSWIDFTRSINAVTLFGRWFGEIIKPARVCSQWTTLPKGMSYLAVCQSDLEEIMDADGDPFSSPVRLSHQLSWFIPSPSASACQCHTAENAVHSDLAQVILPSSLCKDLLSSNTNIYKKDGAVFFGYNSAHRWFWGDKGDPSQEPDTQSRPLTRKRPLAPSTDSGIGESLETSSSGQSQGMDSTGGLTIPSSLSSDCSTDSPVPSKRVCTRSEPGQLRAESYSVGIICALHLELMAVRALLDPLHDDISIPHGDPNYYTFGCMGRHRVVTACLPDGEYGMVPAAEVISHMKRSFPSVNVCLLVGIGGGVPSERHDIRLGDVVVSTPRGSNSGVIPYDVRKVLAGGDYQHNAYLPPPPRHLRCALSKIKSDPMLYENPPLEDSLRSIARDISTYQRPEPTSDRLFNAAFAHPSGPGLVHDTCDHSCPSTQEVLRMPRVITRPRVHYGAIASGNQLMKDGISRDILAKRHDVLCFETEAAGIMHAVPALVIRGICDYADSHKNKRWQRYAAATAAAYARFLLLHVRSPWEGDL